MEHTGKGKINKYSIAALIACVIALLMAIEYFVLSGSNRRQAYQTSTVLADQVKSVLSNNERKERALIDSLKDDYIARAKSVSYIIDRSPELETDMAELSRIANLMSIDEIHLFDASGVIYTGTVPLYYGYSFDSGEQMAYFKPMLQDRNLSMCQDVTPNTAEGKAMMYAICWNDAGTRMTQVGVEPVRLLEELRDSEVSEVIAGMPSYDGIEILIADWSNGTIIGSTSDEQVGRRLDEIGIAPDGLDLSGICKFSAVVSGRPSYCVADMCGDNVIVIVQDKAVVNRGIPSTMVTVLAYLLLAAAAVVFVVRRMTTQIIEEQRNANTDQMTDLLNRRAYETDLMEYSQSPYQENFVYVSADLNGLKSANDNFGHAVGDELIQGAAQCMRRCFGKYGKLYRIGGDEFAVMLHADEKQLEQIKEDFVRTMEAWSEQHGRKLAVSCGYVLAKEFPDKSGAELAKLADARMYQAKNEYYRSSGLDRRRR